MTKQSEYPASGPRSDPGTSRIRSKSVIHPAATFGNIKKNLINDTERLQLSYV
jgi:hypothetical protein